MNRRQVIIGSAALLGTIAVSTSLLKELYFTIKSVDEIPDLVPLLDQVADTMLPTTADSPGAKAASCGEVMAGIINKCYTPEDNKLVAGVLEEINQKSQKTFNKDFSKLSRTECLNVLTPFDVAKEAGYVKLKELTVFVYFTSEIGMHKALRYVEVPGKYDGSMPYMKGDKAWAWSFYTY